jgi:hypothetical protein
MYIFEIKLIKNLQLLIRRSSAIFYVFEFIRIIFILRIVKIEVKINKEKKV